jgi:hypothetical protein
VQISLYPNIADEITKHAFLNYDVESEKLLASKKDFEKLSLAYQLECFMTVRPGEYF